MESWVVRSDVVGFTSELIQVGVSGHVDYDPLVQNTEGIASAVLFHTHYFSPSVVANCLVADAARVSDETALALAEFDMRLTWCTSTCPGHAHDAVPDRVRVHLHRDACARVLRILHAIRADSILIAVGSLAEADVVTVAEAITHWHSGGTLAQALKHYT